MEILTVENEDALRRVFDFGDLILNHTAKGHTVYKWEFWVEQFRRNPHLLLYAQDGPKIVGAVWGWVGQNNNITVGMVAVAEGYRRRGIGRKLMEELVRRVKAGGHRTIALGARKEAESFYLSCGFYPTLFVQSRKRSLAELRALNASYEELWAVESDANGWAKLMLRTPVIDEELAARYDNEIEDCVPQTVFLLNP